MIIAKISKKINRPDNFILFYLITLRTDSKSITNKRVGELVGGWVDGLGDWWVGGLVSWGIGELVGWGVCGLVGGWKNYLFLFANPSRSAKNVETKGITV